MGYVTTLKTVGNEIATLKKLVRQLLAMAETAKLF